jgi:hypothetical protein
MRRAVGRRRRRQAAARIAAAVAVVGLGAGAVALATAGGGGPTVQTPATRPPTTAEPGPTTSRPIRVDIGNISFEPPPGWTAVDLQSGGPTSTARAICVAPAGNPEPRYEGCSGVMVYSGDPLPGYQGAPYERDGIWQFAHSTEPIPCPFDPTGSTIEPGPAGLYPINNGGRPVGDRTADYNQWFARCGSAGGTFTPEAWLLPQSKILILDMFGHPETEALLASVEFTPA